MDNITVPQSTSPISPISPLSGFYRKSKFQITLPSTGNWYPAGAINLNSNSTVDVFAMTAADDIKFRAGEASLSGNNTYNLIKNCIPNIIDPVNMPSIDLDSILLAIRRASYGNTMEITCDVPNTTLVRRVIIDIAALLSKVPGAAAWDSVLNIRNDQNDTFIFNIKPSPVKNVFEASKGLIRTRQQINVIAQKAEGTDEDLQKFDSSVNYLGNLTVTIVASSIESIVFPNGQIEKNPAIILELLNHMDVEYFSTIKTHLETQRNKFALKTDMITSTDQEIASGAPPSWQGDVVFAGSDFFAQK